MAPSGERLVVYTGTLESYQGIDLLLEAFAFARLARRPGAARDRRWRRRPHRRAACPRRELGCAGSVRLVGRLEPERGRRARARRRRRSVATTCRVEHAAQAVRLPARRSADRRNGDRGAPPGARRPLRGARRGRAGRALGRARGGPRGSRSRHAGCGRARSPRRSATGPRRTSVRSQPRTRTWVERSSSSATSPRQRCACSGRRRIRAPAASTLAAAGAHPPRPQGVDHRGNEEADA